MKFARLMENQWDMEVSWNGGIPIAGWIWLGYKGWLGVAPWLVGNLRSIGEWNPWNLKEIPGRECSHGMPWDQLSSLVFHIFLWKITILLMEKSTRSPMEAREKSWENHGPKQGTESIYSYPWRDRFNLFIHIYTHQGDSTIFHDYSAILFNHIQPTIFMIIHDYNHEYDILLPTNDYSWLSEGNIIGIQPYSTNPSKKAVATPIVFQLKGKS